MIGQVDVCEGSVALRGPSKVRAKNAAYNQQPVKFLNTPLSIQTNTVTENVSFVRIYQLFIWLIAAPIKTRLHRRFLSPQLNAIFVAPKLQLQNRTCKPLCDFGAILPIYRRRMRYNSRNTVTLSSIFTFQQAQDFCLRNRRVLTFVLTNCTKIEMKSQLVATSARQKLH